MPQKTLSVIIITKNAGSHIQRCLKSVAWVDEIIVLDSGSTDDTIAICQQYTDQVYSTDWPGFGAQKNRALSKATGQWVLSIDADEWVSEELAQEIKSIITHMPSDKKQTNAYCIPRRTQYLGHWVYYGDVGKDKVVRLFRRGYAHFTHDIVHESLIVTDKRTEQLKYYLYHESYRTLEELQDRMNRYTTLTATIRHQQGKRASITTAVTHAVWAFIKAYVLRGGFLDGRIGFIIAISSAESSYYRYLKLLWLQQGK